MNYKKSAIAGLTVIAMLITGCGPKKPMITQQQISDARNSGTLVQLYEKVQQDIQTSSGSSKESLLKIAHEIEEQMAADKQQSIYQTIEDKRLPSGVTSLSVLEQLKSEAEALKAWNETRYNNTRQKISAESTAAQDALAKQLVSVGKIPVENQVERINAMSLAAAIAGEGSQHYEAYLRQKEQTLVNWMVDADTALANRKYTLAATFLRKVLGLDPDNAEALEKLSRAEQDGFETRFRKALEDSKPELAYSELMRVAGSPLFDSVKGSLASSIQLLNDFFINRALQSSSQGALKTAYKNFLKARKIREVMGQDYQKEAEYDFLKKLMNLAASLGQSKRYGEQLAYLEIVHQFNPGYPGAEQALADARKTIIEYASTSMLVKDFSQTGTHHSAGKSVAQKTYSWIYENMPGEIALVSAQQMANADADAPGRLLLLEGDILEAGVDNENSNGKKTMRVVTQTTKTPNPKYTEWREDGAKGEAPPEFLISEKTEDVTINVIHSRKTGILSVNYRLLEQKSGQVLINQSARDKQLFEAEGNEGVSIGEYNLPFKRPELPSDLEIMEQLSTKVAEQIGAKFKEMLSNPDQHYEELGDKAESQKQYAAAVNNYGYAAAIRSAKQNDISAIREKLINTVIEH